MKGALLIYRPDETRPRIVPIAGEPQLDMLKDAIGGGYLEPVPYFTTIAHDGELRRCVAFCDEDGKQKKLGFNTTATFLWEAAMLRSAGCSCRPDYLVGPVAVAIGDPEFMESL